MSKMYSFLFLGLLLPFTQQAQIIPIKEAIDLGVSNYGKIKAEKRYTLAVNKKVELAKQAYLPDVNFSTQQAFGTINGQNGPLISLGGLNTASSGLPFNEQNWKAAFGSLYLVNVNWNFFNFGRIKQAVYVANSELNVQEKNVSQEVFQHQIKIVAEYLNLLASQRLKHTQQQNLKRIEEFEKNINIKVKTGLLPSVDATTAAAEVAKAKITLNQISNRVSQSNSELLNYLGIKEISIQTDTLFINKIPKASWLLNINEHTLELHPSLQVIKSKIIQSEAREKWFVKEALPSFHLLGIYQMRGSGFESNFGTNPDAYSQNYFTGIEPKRQNYLFGIGVVFNLTQLNASHKKKQTQQFVTEALKYEQQAIEIELYNLLQAAQNSYQFALQNYKEAPLQVTAAQQAYNQRLALYTNGLSEQFDVINAQYQLNRAEMDRDIAYTNLWQALLMVAAASGDFQLFINEF